MSFFSAQPLAQVESCALLVNNKCTYFLRDFPLVFLAAGFAADYLPFDDLETGQRNSLDDMRPAGSQGISVQNDDRLDLMLPKPKVELLQPGKR